MVFECFGYSFIDKLKHLNTITLEISHFMIRVFLLMIVPLLLAASVQAQPTPDSTLADSTLAEAYRIFRVDGQRATLDDVFEAIAAVDVVFLGEQHDDPVAHYLQAELLTQTRARMASDEMAPRPLALSLEMFERDVQLILDEYLDDLITESHFLRSSRPWQNYKTDYRPMVEFMKAHGFRVLAANAPRRYANRVSRKGPASLEDLSVWAKGWLPPLPTPGPSPAYKAKWDKLMAEMMAPKDEPKEDTPPADTTAEPTPEAPSHKPSHEARRADTTITHTPQKADTTAQHTMPKAEEKPASPMHGLGYMLDAQAFWDANMAFTLHIHLADYPGSLVFHVTGSFHVEEGLGTPAQLEIYRPGTRRLIIVTKATDDFTTFDAEEHSNLGDFVILTDKSLPRSYESSMRQ